MASQLNIQIKLGTEFDQGVNGKLTESPIENLRIGGINLQGTCNFKVDEPTMTADERNPVLEDAYPHEVPERFTPATGNAGHEVSNATAYYSCILIPQTVAANTFTIAFSINDKEYQWTSTAPVILESGTSYTLELTVGKDIVVAGNMSVKPWDTSAPETQLNTD